MILSWILSLALAAAMPAPHNAANDFDFNFGAWHTHIKRLVHASGSADRWLTYDGTVTVRPVWGGAANVEEIEADGPSHLEFLNVRMYNAKSHQWSLNGASSAEGTLEAPMYGAFSGGRGVFYDQEQDDGHTVIVRQTFFDITPNAYDFEQAFSSDGGATWKANFVAHLVRVSRTASSEGSRSVADTSHDFDFNYGTWSTHITTYAPSATYTGTVAVRKIWNGRALMEEIKAGNAAGGFEGLTLFLYNPQTREWSQTFAGKDDASFEPSMIGTFKDGCGTLVSFPVANAGEMQFVREVWSSIAANTHHFEIQYSADGKTWRPSFVANLRRIGPGL
jgi:hypothetical protein